MTSQAGKHGEGVIQYVLHHEAGSPPDPAVVSALEAVRSDLFARGVIGRDPRRYDGLGYGNLSCRAGTGFVISGTQTGHLPVLGDKQYVTVSSWDIPRFALWSFGGVKPSSEAMTHAMLYEALPETGAILHVHAPEAWQRLQSSGFPETPAEAGYGSPAMVSAVAALASMHGWREAGVMVMAGHQDGIIAFGVDLAEGHRQLMSAMALP